MVILNNNLGFEVTYSIDRELPTNELLGRRAYLQLNKILPNISTIGEVEDWSNYTVKLPKNIVISFANFKAIDNINYIYSRKSNTIHLKFSLKVTPIEARTFSQHLFNEVTKCQRKNNPKK